MKGSFKTFSMIRMCRRLRMAGNLLLVYSLLGLLWPLAPMHLRETLAAGGSTVSDTIHIALGVVTEITYLFALGIAATTLGRKFRVYSLVTFLILLICGILTFLEAPGVAVDKCNLSLKFRLSVKAIV